MTDGDERVELILPASPEWLALARTTGAGIASRWQFTYDEIADLRLAIDELCLTLIKSGASSRLRLVYALDGGSIEVVGTTEGPRGAGVAHEEPEEAVPGSPASATDLSERILDALVDSHGVGTEDGVRRAWLRKERSIAPT